MGSRKIKLQRVERNPESEKPVDPSLHNKTDAEIKSLLYCLGVCRRCTDYAVAMLRVGRCAGEPIGFAPCGPKCRDGISAVLTMQRH